MTVINAMVYTRGATSRYDSAEAFGTPMPESSSLSVYSSSELVLDKTTSDS